MDTQEFKKLLSKKIINGDFEHRSEILNYIINQGFIVTRNGSEYLSFKPKKGGRNVRVRNLPDRLIVPKYNKERKHKRTISLMQLNSWSDGTTLVKRGKNSNYCGIYALVALDKEDTSVAKAYIGQTVDISRRLKEHLNNEKERWAQPLKTEAQKNSMPVFFILLENSTSGSQADVDEYLWTRDAEKQGVDLPNKQSWAKGKGNYVIPNLDKTWPDKAWVMSNGILIHYF